jgi:hypothetical protein
MHGGLKIILTAQIIRNKSFKISEPKKIGFIFTTKITKEEKNKIYNLRALRGVIKLFFATKSTKIINKELNLKT